MVRSTYSVLGARVSRLLKTGLLMCGLVALAPIPGASQGTATLGKAFVLQGGQTVTVGGTKLSITVRAVRDTRCPKSNRLGGLVACPWAGNAMVRLVVAKLPNAALVSIEVNTHGRYEFPRDRRVHGYVIRLVKLTPHRDTRFRIKLQDYRVTLLVRKA